MNQILRPKNRIFDSIVKKMKFDLLEKNKIGGEEAKAFIFIYIGIIVGILL